MLWEKGARAEWRGVRPCAYRKRLAEVGMVWWADVTNPGTGAWLSWAEARQKFGARLSSAADRRDYDAMLADLDVIDNAQHVQKWRTHVAANGVPRTAAVGRGL